MKEFYIIMSTREECLQCPLHLFLQVVGSHCKDTHTRPPSVGSVTGLYIMTTDRFCRVVNVCSHSVGSSHFTIM